MYRINSKIDLKGDDFIENRIKYEALMKEFYEKEKYVKDGGSEKSKKSFKNNNKLLVRERINHLLDTNEKFYELSTLAANGIKDDSFPSAGIVTGFGKVKGKWIMVIANDATVKGGTYMEITIKKHLRAQEIARENKLPCVYLVDSGGVFLPDQSKVFADVNHFGRFFYNQARMSAEGIPQISIVMGSCTAGGAYIPAMSDESIIVKKQGTIFIGGPPLVKAATNQDVSSEELGGGEMHTSVSGTADYLADNDKDAIQICRKIIDKLPQPNRQVLNISETENPFYNPKELYGIAPLNFQKPVNVKEIIARLVDGSKFLEFKKRYAPSIITGFAEIKGITVGIVASNGILFSETSLKGAHFIEMCGMRKIPLLFLQNITGFMVGLRFERGGIAKDGAKMVHAVANANVPKFTLIFGGSFGAGNYAMCGRGYSPRFLFTWPNSRTSVMGGPQAASVLTTIKESQLKGKKLDEKVKSKIEKEIISKYEQEGSPYYSTARIWDDGIIDPLKTRDTLAACIDVSYNTPFEEFKNGIFRM